MKNTAEFSHITDGSEGGMRTCKKCGGIIEDWDDGAHGICRYCAEDEANACAFHDGQIGRASYQKMHIALEKRAGREIPSATW